jgi:hypothetical protein
LIQQEAVEVVAAIKSTKVKPTNNAKSEVGTAVSARTPVLQALTKAALLLPGILANTSEAAEPPNSVVTQYARYAEGIRKLGTVDNSVKPLSVETLSATGHLSWRDSSQFSFSLTQDSWSGATPVTTAPLMANSHRVILQNSPNGVVKSGASPLLNGVVSLDRSLTPVELNAQGVALQDSRNTLVMSSASPEIRKQADLTYRWVGKDKAWRSGVGVSTEPDFLSRFASVGGQLDFNQKHTTLDFTVTYASNAIKAVLDPDALPYITRTAYSSQLERSDKSEVLRGKRADRSAVLSLTQVINAATVADLSLSISENRGLIENPYKTTSVIFAGANALAATGPQIIRGDLRALMEQRPDLRQQRALKSHLAHQFESLGAAIHLSYQYTGDDWGIEAHSVDLQWVQPWQSWTFTPHVRWYTQQAADFYAPYLVSAQDYRSIARDSAGRELWFPANDSLQLYARTAAGDYLDKNGAVVDATLLDLQPQSKSFDYSRLPAHFSSDHRLAAFGSVTAGLTVSKEFGAGFSLEAGLEYYRHASSLAAGGTGNSTFADVNAVMANVGMQIDLDSATRRSRRESARPASSLAENSQLASSHSQHAEHDAHAHNHFHAAPVSLTFSAHPMTAGSFMTGYRFSTIEQSSQLLKGSEFTTDAAIVANGCGALTCRMAPQHMTMSMHMVDFSYAVTDRLTLMLMPQFMNMEMQLRELVGAPSNSGNVHVHNSTGHQSNARGDTMMVGLFHLGNVANPSWTVGIGLSAPTGKVDLEFERRFQSDGGIRHFDMQTGSGTWDFLPSLTYSQAGDLWYWGSQVNGIVRLEDSNSSGYRLGNLQELAAWLGATPKPWLALSLRTSYSKRAAIKGDFDRYSSRSGPMDFPQNQGGTLWDLGLGASVSFAGSQLSAEWSLPLHEDVNGYQLERRSMLSAAWRYNF